MAAPVVKVHNGIMVLLFCCSLNTRMEIGDVRIKTEGQQLRDLRVQYLGYRTDENEPPTDKLSSR